MRAPIVMAHPVGQEVTAASWRSPAVLATRVVFGTLVGSWLLVQGPVQGFLTGARHASPPVVQPHVHVLLVPYWASFAAAAFVGLALSSGAGLRRESPATQARAVWVCGGLAVLLALVLYLFLGYVLPVSTRHVLLGPERAAGFAPDYPPYLLTNGELSSLQAYFRRQGGYSPGLALMWHLRAWCTLMAAVVALLAAAAVGRARRDRLVAWFCGLELGVLLLFFLGALVAVGPGAFARPWPLPQNVAWGVLAALGCVAVLMFRRTVQALEAEEFEAVLARTAGLEGSSSTGGR